MNLEDRVRLVLESWPEARENEGLLLASVWSNEMEDKKIKIIRLETYLFMSMLMEGKLSPASDILRIAKMLQEYRPDLEADTPPKTVDEEDIYGE